MQIILAKTAGFCFGVDRAVEMVNESVRRGNKTATLGPIMSEILKPRKWAE